MSVTSGRRTGMSSLLNRLPILSIVITGLASAAIIVAMPGVLAGLSASLRLTSSQIALISSSEMFGITATTVAVAGRLARLDRRRAALAALVLLVLANLLSFLAPNFPALITARFAAGLAAGALQGIMSASIATTPIPDRIFAIYLTANLTASTILLGLLSHFSAAGHPAWLFLVVVAMGLSAMLLLPWLPDEPTAQTTQSKGPKQQKRALGAAALAATFSLLVGIGLTWPLVGVLGLARKLSSETMANTLSIATMGGISASLLVSAAGNRFGRRLPISVGTLGLCAAVLLFIVFDRGQTNFAIAAFTFLFCWVLALPYYSGVVAALDPSGRLSVLWMAMQFAGLAIGPIIAAGLLHWSISRSEERRVGKECRL